MDSDAAASMTPALSDLVGRLDSQLRALCRNLESLAYSHDRRLTTTSSDAAAVVREDGGEENSAEYPVDEAVFDGDR